jgi:hypothetical protein
MNSKTYNAMVLHAPKDVFFKILETFDREERAQVVRENYHQYDCVVEIPDCKSLDEAYSLTQNFESPWAVRFGIEDQKRSTSVGDVIVMDGKAFMVDSFGFTQMAGLEYDD